MFNKNQTIQALDNAVKARGEEYVYPRGKYECVYVFDRGTNPRPGCIVGQAYYELTGQLVPEDDEFLTIDGTSISSEFTPDAIQVLTIAQDYQDDGEPWGLCVKLVKLSDLC